MALKAIGLIYLRGSLFFRYGSRLVRTPLPVGMVGLISSSGCLIPYTFNVRSALFCSFLFFVLRGLPPCCWTVMCFVVFTFHSLDHTSSSLFDSFLFLQNWIHSEPASTISELWGASTTLPQGFGGRYSLSLGRNCKIPLKLIRVRIFKYFGLLGIM